MPTVAIHSEEVNALVFRYLEESGFRHSSFAFHHEAQLEETGLLEEHVEPGALIRVLHKGLQYMRLEAHVNSDGTERACVAPFSLIQPHKCSTTASHTMDMDKDGVVDAAGTDEERSSPIQSHAETMVNVTESNVSVAGGRGKRGGRGGASHRRTAISTVKADDDVVMAVDTTIDANKALDRHHSIVDADVLSLVGHTSEVYVGAWNPTQPDVYASGSGDGTARIWKLPADMSETPAASVLNHPPWPADSKNQVTALCWNAAGTLLATGSFDGQVRIWTLKGAMRFLMAQHSGPVFALKWNKTGTRIISGGADKSIVLWETTRGEEVRTYRVHEESVLDLDWRDDMTFASSSVDKTICILSTESAEPIQRLVEHSNEVNCIRWDPTGTLLASSADDSTAKTWSVDTPNALHTLAANGAIYAMQWRPMPSDLGSEQSGVVRMLATASYDFIVRLWNADTGELLHNLAFHTANVYSLGFSRDGALLASGSFDFQLGIWDVQEGTLEKYYRGGGGIFEVGWNSDNSKLAACFSNHKVIVIDQSKLV